MDIPVMKLQEMNEEKDIFRLLDRGIDDMEEKIELPVDEAFEMIIVTWEAIYDIVDIAESIELNFGKEVADNFQAEIYSKIISLERDADIFRKLDMTYRGWTIKRRIYKKSLIFYVVKENEVHVLRVLTSDQKWEDLFKDDVEYTYPT